MANFEWKEIHIEWFLKTFGACDRELSAGDVEKRYRPRKGEPRKGKSKSDEITLDMQDFRNLMRLIVLNKNARVTSSHFKSKRYKIKITSDKYSYIRQDFDSELFLHPLMQEDFPLSELMRKTVFPSFAKILEDFPEALFQRHLILAKCQLYALRIHDLNGGDFDIIFESCQNALPQLDESLILGIDDKDSFVLKINYYTAFYKLISVGMTDLQEYYVLHKPTVSLPDRNSIFAYFFHNSIITDFLLAVERRDFKINPRTASNYLAELMEDIESTNDVFEKHMTRLKSRFVPSYGLQCRLKYIDGITSILRNSSRPEVKAAIRDFDKYFEDSLEWLRTRLNRSRRSR